MSINSRLSSHICKSQQWHRRSTHTLHNLDRNPLTKYNTQVCEDGTLITRLPNGVRVATEPSSGHFYSLGIFAEAGSRYETARTRGASHILDRLAFKSTKTRTQAQMLEDLRCMATCTSSREAIVYQCRIFKRDLRRMLGLLSEVVRYPRISHEEVIEQRKTAAYELQALHAHPDAVLPDMVHAAAFRNNTLGNPLLCSPEKLAGMTRETLRHYRDTWFKPDRLVVAAVGPSHEDMVRFTEECFGDMKVTAWPGDSPSAKSQPSANSNFPFLKMMTRAASSFLPSPPSTPREMARQRAKYTGGRIFTATNDPLTHIQLAFEGVSVRHEDIYTAAVLQVLLGGGGAFSSGGPGKGVHSRLYKRVLQRYGWVHTCHAFNYSYSDAGLFGIAASTQPRNAAYLVDVIAHELNQLSQPGGLPPDEVERAKTRVASGLAMGLECSSTGVEDLGRQVQILGRRVGVQQMLEKIARVTSEDVMRLAGRLLNGPVTLVGMGAPEGIERLQLLT
ncbi:uncharacterized protein VTP21DRAFT_2445 [Calcarisporiella thermophila]|uniref:uncharacterized protein n=1 Tax=Calcarisporiella thermophila TaxID=911321 RepID=UPI0037443A5E